MTSEPSPQTLSPHAKERHSTAQLIEHQRLVSLYRTAPLPLIAGLVYVPVLLAALWPTVGHGLLLPWALARVAAGAARLFDARRFHRLRPTPREIAPWQRRGLVLLCIDAVVWGAIGPLFLTPKPGVQQTMVVATLIALPSLGALTLVAQFRWMAVFTCTVLLPAMAVFVAWRSAAGAIGVAGCAVLMAVLLAEGRRAMQRWNELHRLRYNYARIAEESRELLQLAEQAAAAKMRFLATVSHELRTPLNGIIGMTQVLLARARDDAQRAQLDTMARAARHLRHLIDDLIDLSHAHDGALALRREPFALATAIHDVVQAQESAARDKGLRLQVVLPPDLPALVLGDAVRVKQVLHNLVGNAIKYTPHGRVVLEVEHHNGEPLRFTVRDTGPGIAPEWAPLIFNAFEHVGQRRPDAGLGLGLAISRQIARSMGGDIVWEAGTPGGSVFVFTAAAPEVAADAQDQARAQRRRFDARVLLVEDNAVNAEVAAALLRHLGFAVERAHDGHEALERLAESAFDVVLMDCELPHLDGCEATRRWRAIEQQFGDGRHLPIVALTTNAVAGDRERCIEFGMDDCVAKPFEVAELEATLARVLPPGCAGPG